ncbi:MAG: FAD-binding oxidoreductase, partial [Hyphomicrobiales bacterium]
GKDPGDFVRLLGHDAANLGAGAAGKGSRIYGRTSDYIEAMDVVLADGSDFRVEPLSPAQLDALCGEDSLAGRACAEVRRVVTEQADEIARIFPRMNRGLTGYNLQRTLDAAGGFSLHRLLAGSEGTLALTKSVTLRVLPKPAHRALAVIRYASVDAALSDVGRLLEADPLAVEFLDENVIALARQDIVWAGIGQVLGGDRDDDVKGMNFVEFVGESEAAIASQLAALEAVLAQALEPSVVDWKLIADPGLIAQLWTLREKSVGLLGKVPGRRQGTAFVEDAAVPPDRLPDFVRAFRALLDRHGLAYGMYGHADVGCLHVRPLLDMKDPGDAALVRPISDEVARLTRDYGGLLWGEHGRGYRGEYSPFFFGPVLYAELCRIKTAFDPQNILNPGKLTTSLGGVPVEAIDAVPLRGTVDATIRPEHADGYERALACNGNGVCFSWDADEAMCPSFKATRDR